MKKGLFGCATFILGIIAAPLQAEYLYAVPTAWRLENYIGGIVAVYYSNSSCANGALIFTSSATADDKNRFWSLVMTAKVANKPIGINYSVVGEQCQISSFFLLEQ